MYAIRPELNDGQERISVYTEPIFEEPSPVQIQVWKIENFVEEEVKRQAEQIAARENLIHFDTDKTYDESFTKH